MAQQLNLFDPRFARQTLRGSARQGLWAMAGAFVLGWAASQGLHWAAGQARAAAVAGEATMAPLQAQLMAQSASTPGSASAELLQLKNLDAAQRRIRAALDAGVAGHREGHADYLVALARQASDRLWITGFALSEDGSAIDLEGRMTDASALTHYLRQLNAEPRFKGRPFAQLSLRAVDPQSGALPYTEFALRSVSAASPATPPTTPSAGLSATVAANGRAPTP
jgi:Tfp pilus assembly protein PilN